MCGRGGGAKYVVFFMNFTFRLWLARTWIRTFFSAFSFLEFFSSGNSFWKLTCVLCISYCVFRSCFPVHSLPCPGLRCPIVLRACFFSVFSCFPSAVFVWVPSFFRPYTRVRILQCVCLFPPVSSVIKTCFVTHLLFRVLQKSFRKSV